MQNNKHIIFLLLIYLNANAQENKTTFGLQFKPILSSKIFNYSHVNSVEENYNFNLVPNFSYSYGMVIRDKLSRTFTIEYGLNYVDRNFKLEFSNSNIKINDFSKFDIRSYECPIQLLTYVQVSEKIFLNASFGFSYNVLTSDIQSFANNTNEYYQIFYRKKGGYIALLSNLGSEFRSDQKGNYYLGISLHLPFSEIGRLYPYYDDTINEFNNLDFNNQYFMDISGRFVTLDFRYFFKEN